MNGTDNISANGTNGGNTGNGGGNNGGETQNAGGKTQNAGGKTQNAGGKTQNGGNIGDERANVRRIHGNTGTGNVEHTNIIVIIIEGRTACVSKCGACLRQHVRSSLEVRASAKPASEAAAAQVTAAQAAGARAAGGGATRTARTAK